MNYAWIAAIVCSLGSGGCIFGSRDSGADSSADDGGDDGDSGSADDQGAPPYEELNDCRGDATDEEVIDTVAITDAYADSLHEMVACGMLTVKLCTAIVEGVLDAIVAGSNDATPDGWGFDAGVYRAAGDGVEMEARFFYAQDFGVGNTGEQVQHNLFLVDSYLVGAELIVDLTTGESEIRYDAPGPLVELLGFGADPPNPLPTTWDDLAEIENRLRTLDFETVIVLDDVRDKGTIRYHIETPRMSAGALLDGSGLVFGLVEADGERQPLEQTLIVDLWDVEFVERGSLDGEVDFHVDGLHFPFRGVFRWNESPYPDRELACP